MKARIENGKLIIEIDLTAPTPSKSGKNLTIATTAGNKPTTAQFNGKVVTVGLSAYIPAV